MIKFKDLGVLGLSSMWPTDPYNLPHLCSGIYKVLLPFLQKKQKHSCGILRTFLQKHSCGILKTFLPVKDLSVDSTQLYV